MAHEVDVDEATAHFSRLLAIVEDGGEVVINRGGRPVARLVPDRVAPTTRTPGAWRGRVEAAEDVDQLPDDVAAAFRGEVP